MIITENDFLGGVTGPSKDGECSFAGYLKDISYEPRLGNLRKLSGYSSYALSDDGFNVYLQHMRGPDGEFEMVGYYHDSAVCIHPNHQGKGLGVELVLAATQLRGEAPLKYSGKFVFSKAGWALHKRAYQVGLERGIFQTEGISITCS